MKKIKQEVKIVIKSLPVIILSMFLVMTVIHAWSGPPGLPPFCPTGDPGCDAPINVSGVTQLKAGAFGVGGLFETSGNTYLAKSGGNVGIGTVSPGAKLDIQGSGANGGVNIASSASPQITVGKENGWSNTSLLAWGWNATDNDNVVLNIPGSNAVNMNLKLSQLKGFIFSNGNVGIGTTEPAGKLHVETSVILDASRSDWITNVVPSAIYRSNDLGSAYPFKAAGNLIIQARSSATRDIVFATGYTTPSVKMVIQGDGNVGIGTTTPAEKLHVNGTIRTTIVNCGQLGTDANGNIVCKD
jgi:hypothetical protein